MFDLRECFRKGRRPHFAHKRKRAGLKGPLCKIFCEYYTIKKYFYQVGDKFFAQFGYKEGAVKNMQKERKSVCGGYFRYIGPTLEFFCIL